MLGVEDLKREGTHVRLSSLTQDSKYVRLSSLTQDSKSTHLAGSGQAGKPDVQHTGTTGYADLIRLGSLTYGITNMNSGFSHSSTSEAASRSSTATQLSAAKQSATKTEEAKLDGKPSTTALPLVTPGTPLIRVLELYEAGQYQDSLAASEGLGNIANWPGPEGRVMAGRLANNLGSPRLGRILHLLAYRRWPEHPYCLYYGALARWSRIGILHAWREFGQVDMPVTAEPRAQADWLALKALMLAGLRDFSRAEKFITEAVQIDPLSAWLQVERCEILDRQDAHQAALEAAQAALELQPWFRPAVQSLGHKLVQLNRDDEALKLLAEATQRLQSGDVWCQLGVLQEELKDYDAAWHSLSRAEALWPLAERDGAHHKWLAGRRSDIAYYRGDYQQAIELARQVDRPFYQQLVEKLEAAVLQSEPELPPRVQLSVPFIRQHHDTCAPATLTALAQYWKKSVQHEEIVQRICYEGTMASDERRWAEENDFLAREFRITAEVTEQLIRAGIPFTLNTVDPGSAHLQAVVGFDLYRGTFLIQDPSERHVSEASMEKLLEHYQSSGPRGMVMLPKEEAQRLDGIELPDAELYDPHYTVDQAIEQHRRDEAADALQRMQELAPEHRLTLQSELALARYDANTVEQLRLTEKLLVQFPGDPNLTLMQLYGLNEFGTRRQRLEILRRICDDKKTHPIFWARLASELIDDARDHPEAYQQLRKALRYHQSDGRSMSLLGNLLWEGRKRDEALELYRVAASASEKDENFARTYFSAARFLHETSTAIGWLQDRVARFGSRSSLPGRTLAWAFEQLDRTPEALELLQQTARQHPEDGDLLCHAALTLGRYNRTEEANTLLGQAEGKCAESQFIRTSAMLANNQGRLEDARELFLQVHAREPLDVATLDYIVSLDMDLGGDAEERLRQAVAQFPHSYSLRVRLIQWLRSNRLEKVKPEIEQFLKDYPDDAWGYREAAIAAAISHDLQAAERFVEHAIGLDPMSDTPYFLLGRIANERGNISQARRQFRAAIEKNCDHEGAILALIETCDRPNDRAEQLAFVLAQLKRQTTFGDGVLAYREAAAGKIPAAEVLAGVEEAMTNRPDLWQCWTALIAQHSAMNQRDKAAAVAREAAERFPLIPRMWLDLALAYRAVGQHTDELAALERARAINPNWTEVARELSEAYMRDEHFEQAEKLLREVLQAEPRNPGSLAALADCLYRADNKSEALSTMSVACVLAPGYDWGWRTLSDWSSELDEGHTARKAAQQLMVERPHDARGPLRLAECLNEIEALPEGLEAVEQALRIDPRNVDAHVLKAFYLGRLHRWDDALEACHPDVFGDDPPVALRMRRAYVLHRKGLLQPAITQMQQALLEDPDQFQAWNQLADWAEEDGQWEVYREASENMIRIDPHQAVPHGYLADALLKVEGAEAAEQRKLGKGHLLRAIELSPEYAYATLKLVDLSLEDQLPDEAERALELGGQHLADGYLASSRIRIASATQSKNDQGEFEAVELLVQWCQTDDCHDRPLVAALDEFNEPIAAAAVARLMQEVLLSPDQKAMGSALGRLIARIQKDKELLHTLRKLPTGTAWQHCLRFVLRSMLRFERKLPLLNKLRREFRRQARADIDSWSTVASTLLNFQQNAEVVAWTKDWPQRTEVTPAHLVSIIAANTETFNLKQAHAAIARGVELEDIESSDASDMIFTWAGLEAVHLGNFDRALAHAQRVNPHNVSGWYALGYRLLTSAVEFQARIAAENDRKTQLEQLRYFDAQRFPIEPQFAEDRLSRWLMLRIQARLAGKLGWKFRKVAYQLRAWWVLTA